MKKGILICLISIILILGLILSILVVRHFKHNTENLEVGYAKINISPVKDGEILPVPLGGYAGLRLADRIESDIYAICTAFRDDSGNTALVYSIDILGISEDVADEIVMAIGESVSVSEDNILLNCMHNHTAPEIQSTIDEAKIYQAFLTEQLILSAKEAIADLSVCTKLYTGCLDIPSFSYIRRDVDTGIDPSVPVARFVRKNKNDVLLVNWSAHCDTFASTDRTAVSSDYIGVLRKALEETDGVNISVQMGACADVGTSCFSPDKHKYIGKEAYGKALASTISSQLKNLTKTKIISNVDSVKTTVGVAVDHSTDECYSKAIEIRDLYYADRTEEYQQKCSDYRIANVYEAAAILSRSRADKYDNISLRAVSIGNIVFAAAPYEMFASNGAKIKELSQFDSTFVLGYTHGRKGYIAADYAYAAGGYEVYSCIFEQGTAELLQSTLSDMVKQLYTPELCRHSFTTVDYDENYHRLKCTLCEAEPTYPSKHIFDESYVCTVCNEHIHSIQELTGFSGLSLSCIGDSITMGAGIDRSYVDVVQDLLGAKTSYNHGISWSTIGHKENCNCEHSYLPEDYDHDPMVYRYNEIPNSDIIFIYGGLNDFGMDLPLGTIEEETPHTFYGALNLLISGLRQNYSDSYIFMATSLNYFDGYKNDDGVTWSEYNEAIREVCKKHSIDCLDLYNLPFDRLIDTSDYVHPTQKFTSNVLAPAIAEFIKNNFPRYYYYNGCVRCDEGEKILYENLFVDTIENHGKICTYDLQSKEFIEKESDWYSYTLINVEDIKEIRFSFTKEIPSVAWSYFFYDKDNVCVGSANITEGLVDVYVKVPNNAVYIGVLYNPLNPYGIYQAS